MPTSKLGGGTPAAATTLRVLRPPSSSPIVVVAAFWQDRGLFRYFGKRFVDRRYVRTHLGWLWIPLRPAFDIGARVLLFGGFLGVASGDRPYFMFFIAGMAAWVLFERTATWATRGIEMNRTLLGRVQVSRMPAVVAGVVPAALDCVLYATIGLIGAIYYYVSDGFSYIAISPSLIAVPAGLIVLALFGIGIGLWAAPLAAKARDVRFISRYVLGFWFFLTPVIYPISLLPPDYQPLARWNPITPPVEMVKYGVIDTAPPELATVWVSLACLVVLLGSGLVFFARAERENAERI